MGGPTEFPRRNAATDRRTHALHCCTSRVSPPVVRSCVYIYKYVGIGVIRTQATTLLLGLSYIDAGTRVSERADKLRSESIFRRDIRTTNRDRPCNARSAYCLPYAAGCVGLVWLQRANLGARLRSDVIGGGGGGGERYNAPTPTYLLAEMAIAKTIALLFSRPALARLLQ